MEHIEFTLETASPFDVGPLAALLARSELPTDDLDDNLIRGFVVARSGAQTNKLVGACGIEICGASGLLRSLVVAPQFRDQSLGRALVENRLVWSQKAGLKTLYLLTLDADPYFLRFGFNRIDRLDLPEEIQATSQFGFLCPATAIAMVLDL